MELSKICQLFTAFTGMTPEEALEQLDLIRISISEVENSLKPGIDLNQHLSILNYAAAAIAFYRYSVIAANTGGIQSIRSGETTIGADPAAAVEIAAAIRDEFLALAAPLMVDRRFGFQAV